MTSELAVRALKFATRYRLKGDLVLNRSVYNFRRVFKQLFDFSSLVNPIIMYIACALAEPLLSSRSVGL